MNYKICIIIAFPLSNNCAFAKTEKQEEKTIPFISYSYTIMPSSSGLEPNLSYPTPNSLKITNPQLSCG